MNRQKTIQGLQDAMQLLKREEENKSRALAETRQRIEELQRLIHHITAASEDVTEVSGVPARGRSQPTKEVRNAMVDILKEAGRPMHSVDLLKALTDRGHKIVGIDPANNVRAYLSNDDRFLPVGRGLWDLASRVRSSAIATVDATTRHDLAGKYAHSKESPPSPAFGAIAPPANSPEQETPSKARQCGKTSQRATWSAKT